MAGMDETHAVPVVHVTVSEGPPAWPRPPTLGTWLREGLRCAFLLPPRVAGQPAPLQLIALLSLMVVLGLALARLEVAGSAAFHASAWLAPWWSAGACLLLMWALSADLPPDVPVGRRTGLASWVALWIAGSLPVLVVAQVLAILRARELLPAVLEDSAVFAWGALVVLLAWMVAVPVALARRYGLDHNRLAALAVGLVAIHAVQSLYFQERPWYSDAPYKEDAPRLSLSQGTFEAQQAAWHKAVAALAPQRAGVRDVYGLVFAPYAGEDVFLRESTMVADLLAQRFDAQGRVLHLANHATTSDSLPWATPQNLRRAIAALGERMDREHDLLVVYLTSHGASNFRLSASHWPLQVEGIAPAELRAALDSAGIRHRVIAISACYSGGWIPPLASDTSLVMTAADPERTSYGCGRRSELTFFGRAVFDEQLRNTWSFERAFAAAVPVIKQREEEAGKKDGFSNPQISVGDRIRPVLAELEKRLDRVPRP